MTQRRHFAYVIAAVSIALAAVVALRAWWQVETRPAENVESQVSPSTIEHAPPVSETPPPLVAPIETPSPTKETPLLAISGCVRDTFGHPIRGAIVKCIGDDGKETRTDHEGRYRIEGLPDHIFAMSAAHPAHFPEQKALVPAGNDDTDFGLPIRATLRVHAVRSDTQEPVAQYFVRFEHRSKVRHSRAKGDGFSDRVIDPSGNTAITDLEPVNGTLRVWQEGYDAQEIQVLGEELNDGAHEIQLAMHPSAAGLEGIVVNTRDEPIEGACIFRDKMAWQGDGDNDAHTRTGRDGRFRVDPTGEPKEAIIASHPGYAPAYVFIYRDTPPEELLRIVLPGMGTVRGRVTLDGHPLEECHVVAYVKHDHSFGKDGTRTDEGGRYELTGLPPGLACVEARVDESDWGVGSGGVKVERTAELVEGQVTPLDFELQRPAASLEGRITINNASVEDASMLLDIESPVGTAHYEARTELDDAGGAYYRIENVVPGKGVLVVATTGAGGDEEIRITQHEVTIPPNGHVVRNITVGGTCLVTGHVSTDESFDIVALGVITGECHLTAYDIVTGFMQEDLEMVPIAAVTIISGGIFGNGKENPEGDYSLPPLDPGTYTILAVGLDGEETISSDRAIVTLRDGQTETVDLRLQRE